jgi:ATP-dependent RNA helicase DHX37/DHR1
MYVGITQPRRVAAVSTAIRVAEELSSEIMTKESDKIDKKNKKQKRNFQPKGIVGYQIRHDSSSIASNTSIKFMTDGILLKEVLKTLNCFI